MMQIERCDLLLFGPYKVEAFFYVEKGSCLLLMSRILIWIVEIFVKAFITLSIFKC